MTPYLLAPRKRFGQHFLHDPTVIQRIVTATTAQMEHKPLSLVEIGAGTGALTKPLLQQCGQLDVIEIDTDLVCYLQQEYAHLGKLRIYQSDALTFDFSRLLTPSQSLRVVGNLPYNISTPLLFHLLDYAASIQDMIFMLQREVVDRIVAQPATPQYGRLSVMLQYHCRVEKLFNVGSGAFHPPPKVDSSVIRLQPYVTPPVSLLNVQDFSKIVTQAFQQRRKTLRNALKGLLDTQMIAAKGIDPSARAETLTVEEFARLADSFTQREIISL